MTKTRDLANLIADSKVGPSEIDTAGTYNMNALQVGGTTVIDSSRNATLAKINTTKIGDGDAGVLFNSHGGGNLDAILPFDFGNDSLYNGHVDIGGASNKFKDLHMSGVADVGSVEVGGTTVIDSSRNATFTTVGTPAGSIAAPAYTFSTDTNTGMFKRGTDQIGFSAGGTEMLALTSTGIFADKLGSKSTGSDLTLDAAGDIILDADGGDVALHDGGTAIGRLGLENGDLNLAAMQQDYDVRIKGNDGGSNITALQFDMSEAGAATFNAGVTVGGPLTVPANSHVLFGSTSTAQWSATTGAGGVNIRGGSNGSYLALANESATGYSNIYLNKINVTSDVTSNLNRFLDFYYDGVSGVRVRGNSSKDLSVDMHGGGKFSILGNVGIDVADPEAKLHVNGAAIIGSQNNASTTPIAGLHILDQTYSTWSPTLSKNQVALRVETYYTGNNSHPRDVGDYGGGIGFNHLGGHSTTHDENLHCWIGPRVTSTAGHEKSALAFATNDVTTDEDSGITERMVIIPNGNVGINETAPTSHLAVGSDYSTNEGLLNVERAVGYRLHHFSGSSGGATKTVTVNIKDFGLNAVEIAAHVTGHKYNSGTNNFAVKMVHVAMEENGNMRINSDRTSDLGYRIGNQQSKVGTMSVSSGNGGNFYATFTVHGEYDTRILIEAKGAGLDYISSISHS